MSDATQAVCEPLRRTTEDGYVIESRDNGRTWEVTGHESVGAEYEVASKEAAEYLAAMFATLDAEIEGLKKHRDAVLKGIDRRIKRKGAYLGFLRACTWRQVRAYGERMLAGSKKASVDLTFGKIKRTQGGGQMRPIDGREPAIALWALRHFPQHVSFAPTLNMKAILQGAAELGLTLPPDLFERAPVEQRLWLYTFGGRMPLEDVPYADAFFSEDEEVD